MSQAVSSEDLFSIIEKLGPIDDENLIRRSKKNPAAWLRELKAANRIVATATQRGDKTHRLWRIREIDPATGTDVDR